MIRNVKILKLMGIKPRTVIHVGAHFGQDQSEYEALGVEKVFWCEADEDCIAIIREKYPSSSTIHGVFWSEAHKTIDFWFMKDSAQNSAFRPRVKSQSLTKETRRTTTLDEEFMALNLKKPIMLVLDVQGAEIEVLKGGKELLSNIKYLVCEITNKSSISNFSVLQKDVEIILDQYGFSSTISRPSYNNEYLDLLMIRDGIFARLRIFIIDYLFKYMKRILRMPKNA